MTVEAKASANPAMEALILGVRIATKAVTPTMALERRLNRAESQRFTKSREMALWVGDRKMTVRAYLPTSSNTD